MAVSLLHQYQSAIADSGDTSVVQPSNWNAEHTLTMATNKLLGRGTAGTGAVEEITLGTGLTLTGTTLDAIAGVTGPGSSTANALVRWSGTGGTALLNNTQWTLADSGALASTGMSLTGSQATSLIDLAATWNTSGAPKAISLNITDTASSSNSRLVELSVGGTPQFNVSKDGTVRANAGLFISAGSGLSSVYLDACVARLGVTVSSTSVFAWTSGLASDSADLFLARDAANTLALRNSTSAQAFNIYNTYTDASNYERGFVRWVSNILEIGTAGAGTGSTSRKTRFLDGSGGAVVEIESSYVGFYNGGTRNHLINTSSTGKINMATGAVYAWGTADTADTLFCRIAAAIIGVRGATTSAGGALNFLEQTAPSAPSANQVVIYAQDNGAGKTQLMALFNTGAAQQIAIEP